VIFFTSVSPRAGRDTEEGGVGKKRERLKEKIFHNRKRHFAGKISWQKTVSLLDEACYTNHISRPFLG